jgi:hypothetical protein
MKKRLRFSDVQPPQSGEFNAVFSALSLTSRERLAVAKELRKRVEAGILADFHPDGVGGYFSEAERFRIAREMLLRTKFYERMGHCLEASEAVEIILEFNKRPGAEDFEEPDGESWKGG